MESFQTWGSKPKYPAKNPTKKTIFSLPSISLELGFSWGFERLNTDIPLTFNQWKTTHGLPTPLRSCWLCGSLRLYFGSLGRRRSSACFFCELVGIFDPGSFEWLWRFGTHIFVTYIYIYMYTYTYVSKCIYPGIPTTIKTMGVNITTIVYLRVLIIQIRSTIILMVVEA